MSGRGFGFSGESFATRQPSRRRWDNYISRGVVRGIIGSVAAVPMLVAMMVAYNKPHGEDNTVCLAVAAVAALLPVLVWRWFGQGSGILWGLFLWLVSYGLLSGITTAARAAVLLVAWMHGGRVDEDVMIASAAVGIALYALCAAVLRRIDGDL